MRYPQRLLGLVFCALTVASCGSEQAQQDLSAPQDFLDEGSWHLADSPFMLKPGDTIGVCDTGVKEGVRDLVIGATRRWLSAGGRDSRVWVKPACEGTRVIKLIPVPNTVSYYGSTSPLSGNVHVVRVPPKWAGSWTANHEIGHVFSFAHNFTEISIMNSRNNGEFMNGGQLSSYDHREIRRMLQEPEFRASNAKWDWD